MLAPQSRAQENKIIANSMQGTVSLKELVWRDQSDLR